MPDNYMWDDRSPTPPIPIDALRSFAQKRKQEQVEHCDLCSEVIPSSHSHLLNLSSRTLVCACQACSLLFSEQGAGAGKYTLVPRRYLALTDFHMADGQWDELLIPVNMAFIFRSTGAKPVMAYYPSPAGATESLLPLSAWNTMAEGNPKLKTMQADVEATVRSWL